MAEKREGRPGAAFAWCWKRNAGTATGWDNARLPALTGARGGFRRAPEPVRRL